MGKSILVVDDEADIVTQIKIRLEANGYSVTGAYSGEEALAKIKSGVPDLILLDVMMPPPNGFQVCRILKDSPEYKDIPIIMLTAKSTESDKFWGVESGADEYVSKPYSAKELLEKISVLLNPGR
ncbi:MAG: response regulator [Candidatus Omnitrophica bacterium]|nr:response regulator [Candidatus Omnitrophota bacterium]